MAKMYYDQCSCPNPNCQYKTPIVGSLNQEPVESVVVPEGATKSTTAITVLKNFHIQKKQAKEFIRQELLTFYKDTMVRPDISELQRLAFEAAMFDLPQVIGEIHPTFYDNTTVPEEKAEFEKAFDIAMTDNPIKELLNLLGIK